MGTITEGPAGNVGQMFVLQIVGEVPAENHCSVLTSHIQRQLSHAHPCRAPSRQMHPKTDTGQEPYSQARLTPVRAT